MPSALQVVLNVRLLIDEVVLQGDYTRHAAPLVGILVDNLGSLFQYVIVILSGRLKDSSQYFYFFLGLIWYKTQRKKNGFFLRIFFFFGTNLLQKAKKTLKCHYVQVQN